MDIKVITILILHDISKVAVYTFRNVWLHISTILKIVCKGEPVVTGKLHVYYDFPF